MTRNYSRIDDSMSYYPPKTNVRSFSNPRGEQGEDLLSPPLTPSFSKLKEGTTNTTRLPPSPALSFRTDSYLQRAASYRNYGSEMDESYPLTDHRPYATPLQVADLDVRTRREKDEKLKTHIRRFRFIVRALNLGCRFFHSRLYILY
jgi:hypothetical protein